MNELLSIISGMIIAYMNFINSKLGLVYGNNISLVIIHLVGLLCLIPFCIKGVTIIKGIPLWCYLGGAIGILTIIFSNSSIPILGVTVQMAISLLGQPLASVIIDHFGLFGLKKYPFTKNNLISIIFIILGTAVMIIW